MDLDEMLATANPTVIERGRGLLDDLDGLALEARAARSRKRRAARWTIVGVAAVAVFGTGSAAVASGFLPFGWTSEQGGRCLITSVAVEIARAADDNEAAFASTTAKQRRDTLLEARRFLAGYDYEAINVDAAIATWQRAEAAAIADQPDPSERAPLLEGDLLENRTRPQHGAATPPHAKGSSPHLLRRDMGGRLTPRQVDRVPAVTLPVAHAGRPPADCAHE